MGMDGEGVIIRGIGNEDVRNYSMYMRGNGACL